VCNIKCPDQKPGERQVCGIEEYQQGVWVPSEVNVLQSADNFCQKAQIINEKAHLAVGNFFQQTQDVEISKSLDCISIRLGDENRRQKITFDLIPPIYENPREVELVIFERANGTRDGQWDARFDSQTPLDNYFPEAFAFSLLVNGNWTRFFYSGVRGSFVEYKGQIVPDWKNQDMGYNLDFDAWATEIEFQDLGIVPESLVTGISIMNLQPGDLISGPIGTYGEVVFADHDKTCINYGECTEPRVDQSNMIFGAQDYDPDIVWIGGFSGNIARRRNL